MLNGKKAIFLFAPQNRKKHLFSRQQVGKNFGFMHKTNFLRYCIGISVPLNTKNIIKQFFKRQIIQIEMAIHKR